MPTKVAILKHGSYEIESLVPKIEEIIKLSGFDLSAVRSKTVLLKPNCLGAFPSSMGVTTNPNFVAAVARVFSANGAKVFMGDSPGCTHLPSYSFKISGLMEVESMSEAKYVSFEANRSTKIEGVMVSNAAFEYDFVVNLPKFKTHSFTALTLCVKNLFGFVNGMQKSRFHYEHRDRKVFAEHIVKIAEAVKPHLNIIDGIVGMEGNGPSNGKLRDLNFIIAGTDMYAVDVTCANILGVEPQSIDTILSAKQLGLFNTNETIEVVGETPEAVRPKNFKMPDTYGKRALDWKISKFIMGLIWGGFSCAPHIVKSKCTKCLACVKACPVQVISYAENEVPIIDQKKCIQCFCCHELCPSRAIKIRRNFLSQLGNIATKIFTRGKR